MKDIRITVLVDEIGLAEMDDAVERIQVSRPGYSRSDLVREAVKLFLADLTPVPVPVDPGEGTPLTEGIRGLMAGTDELSRRIEMLEKSQGLNGHGAAPAEKNSKPEAELFKGQTK